MAHPQQRSFLELVCQTFLASRNSLKILEVGSYSVNGTVRDLFKGADYIGADLCEGPCVDIVSSGHELQYPSESFDLTLSMECFEHNPYWKETFINMHRMAKDLVIVTCASRGRIEHGTSRTTPGSSPGTQAIGSEYYRNLNPRDFNLFPLRDMFTQWHLSTLGTDLYFIGWKKARPDLSAFRARLPAIKEHLPLSQALYYLPATLAAWLPEKAFQDFVLWYMRSTAGVRKVGGRLHRLISIRK
jgi:hypothetical protein